MKWFVRILLVLLVLIAALVLTADYTLGTIVVKAVNTAGPAALGVPLKLEDASFQIFRGHLTLRGFLLGNPEGFKTEKAISVDEVTVELDPKSLLSDTLVIKRIYVNAPDVTYELGLGKSNIGRILEQAGGSTEAGAVKEKPEKKPIAEEKPGKKVVIEDLLIQNGRVRVSATMALGAAAPIPLPEIRLRDIGKEKQGASPIEVIRQVLGAIVGSVTKVVSGAAVDAAGKTAEVIGDGAKAVGSAAADAAGKTAGMVGDGAKAVGGAAVNAAGKTADVVGDGAKAVGGAVVDAGAAVGKGAGKVIGGVTGIFKSNETAQEPPSEQPAE